MALSGTIPTFHRGLHGGTTRPAYVNGTTGGWTSYTDNEAFGTRLRRWLGLLGACSGTLGDAGVTTGLQAFSDAAVSGLREMSHEIAGIVADLELPKDINETVRLARGNTLLTASGEVIFGA